MRKTLTAILVAGLVGGVGIGPAGAGTKTVKKSYTFTAPVPNPVTSSLDPLGCNGQTRAEDVNSDTFVFKTPRHGGRGTLAVRIDGFIADWDLHVFKGKTLVGSSTSDNTAQDYEAVTISGIKGGTKLSVVACNWSSPSPQADGTIVYKYRR